MVDLAKLEAGEIKINKTETNLSLLIKEAISKIKKTDLYKNKDVNIEAAQIDDSIYISTDAYRLMQIVLNLLTNALKFGNQKDVKIGFEHLKAGDLRLFIQDFGIGISEEEKSKIFENFSQIHQSHSAVFGGTGIGLSISKAIANLMNINLNFESELDIGTKFFLEFSKTDIKTCSSSKLNLGSYFWEGKKILIAEDNESNFMYLDSLLKGSGAEIIWGKDGYSALKKFKKEKNTDLILMDILMPGISGIECTKEIRKTNNKVVIIAQTAFQTQSYEKAAFAAGCNEFISKPINPQLLLNTIDSYLGRK
jgi:CheY-like chemotaxis protein